MTNGLLAKTPCFIDPPDGLDLLKGKLRARIIHTPSWMYLAMFYIGNCLKVSWPNTGLLLTKMMQLVGGTSILDSKISPVGSPSLIGITMIPTISLVIQVTIPYPARCSIAAVLHRILWTHYPLMMIEDEPLRLALYPSISTMGAR